MRPSKDLRLPDGSRLPARRVALILRNYVKDNPAVLDLYDRTNEGPHDEVRPVDLLSLNALNAFIGSAPMTPMTALWRRRREIEVAISSVTRHPIEDLDDEDASLH